MSSHFANQKKKSGLASDIHDPEISKEKQDVDVSSADPSHKSQSSSSPWSFFLLWFGIPILFIVAVAIAMSR